MSKAADPVAEMRERAIEFYHRNRPGPFSLANVSELMATFAQAELRRLGASGVDVERLKELADWLDEEALEFMKQAMSRRDGNDSLRSATDEELRSSHALAEKMSGHKIRGGMTTRVAAKEYADMQDRVATKVEAESRKLSNWADLIRKHIAQPAARVNEDYLHVAICQAVALLNQDETIKAHNILREVLVAYAERQAIKTHKCKGCQSQSHDYFEHDGCIVAKTVDKEQGRWQQAIYEQCRKRAISPDDIDGGGCDSGDPLDLTLTEIGQTFCQLENPQDYRQPAPPEAEQEESNG